MTTPAEPSAKYKSRDIVLHDAEGFPTEDRSKAVTAEVTTVYDNGAVKKEMLTLK